jgi:hypothetical protein
MNWEDPIVADVRRIREGLSAQFDFDVAAIFADLRSRQSSVGDRLVRLSRTRKAEQGEVPERPVSPVRNG